MVILFGDLRSVYTPFTFDDYSGNEFPFETLKESKRKEERLYDGGIWKKDEAT